MNTFKYTCCGSVVFRTCVFEQKLDQHFFYLSYITDILAEGKMKTATFLPQELYNCEDLQ